MENYKPNSHRAREEQKEKKKVEKVVKGKVQTKKKSEFGKMADIFISEDAVNVKSYIFMDVLVPAIKKAISDIVTDGIDMILYGGTGHGKRSSKADKISYRNYYDRDRDRYSRNDTRTRSGYGYDDVILESRGEAEDVLTRMDELMDEYGMVSVADLYDLVGISCNYTDNNYGWTNIRNAEVVRVRNGYMIKMPKALPIEK